MDYEVEKMRSEDWEQVKNIYLEGINTGIAKMPNGIWHDVVLLERRSNITGMI